MMNKIPNSANMIGNFLRKRQRFSHSSRYPLSEGIIQAFDRTGFAGLFPNRSVSFGGKDEGIGRPEIRITHGTLTIHRRQGMPSPSGAGFVSAANKDADDVARVLVQGTPNPKCILFVADKRP